MAIPETPSDWLCPRCFICPVIRLKYFKPFKESVKPPLAKKQVKSQKRHYESTEPNQACFASLGFMDADKRLINQLLDALEELLIENGAYRYGLTNLKQCLPPQAQQVSDQMVENAKADRNLREMVHGQLSPLRNQPLERAIEELASIVRPKRDDN